MVAYWNDAASAPPDASTQTAQPRLWLGCPAGLAVPFRYAVFGLEQDYFFIVGCPRSGTTLLSVLLDRHSRLCVPPETAFLAEFPRFLRLRNRASVLKRLRDWPRTADLDLAPEEILAGLGDQPLSRRAIFAAMLDLYAERQGKARCGEKTPRHLRYIPRIQSWFPEAKMICVLRDGRDVALSLAAMPWFGQGLSGAARLWRSNLRLMEKAARQYQERFLILQYETLVSQPETTLRTVMAFLGERFEPQQLSPAAASAVVLPRSLSWKGLALGPIRTDAMHARRAAATDADLRYLDEVLKPELVRYGYGNPAYVRQQ